MHRGGVELMIQSNIPTARFPRCLWVTSRGRRVATAHEVDAPYTRMSLSLCVCVYGYADVRVAHRGLCPDRFMWRYGLIYENVRDNGIWHGNGYGRCVVRSLIRISRDCFDEAV